MLTVDDTQRIRRAYYCEKRSIRAIARKQHHHRRVVREAIAGTSPSPWQYGRQRPRPRPMVGPVSQLIDAWSTADQDAPPKQRHTAKRIFDRLVAEYGYEGRERAVREYVRVLQLHTGFPTDVITAALQRALLLCCWSADGVEQLVHQELLPQR